MPPFLPHPHPLPSTSSSSSSSTSTTSSCLLLRPLPFALELDCPVPWPGTALDASNNLNPLESRTALPCTSVQLLPASDGSPGKGKERELLVAPNNPQISQPEDALQWIRRRYWECLWLSEVSVHLLVYSHGSSSIWHFATS